jgi:hypothetical protein
VLPGSGGARESSGSARSSNPLPTASGSLGVELSGREGVDDDRERDLDGFGVIEGAEFDFA